jgi:hypothetical protein
VTTERSHAEIEELIGAYAIDALDPDERLVVDDHLPTCPRCRAEVADLREVAALLVYSGGDAPAGLWDRIAATLDEVPPPMRLGVVPLDAARAKRRRWQLAAGALAVAAVVLIGAVGLTVRDSGATRTDHLRQAALEAIAEPTSRIANLQATDHSTVARFVVTSDGQGYLLGNDMQPLTDKIYELWGRTSDGVVLSLGVMDKPGTYGFTINQAIDQVLVTVEDEPVTQPSNPAIAGGTLA